MKGTQHIMQLAHSRVTGSRILGKVFIGQKYITTDASGNASFAFSPARKVELGRKVTATATDPNGNTSEFSAPRTVVAG